MRGDEDCRNFYAAADEMLLKLQTVHLRHLEIDNQATRKPLLRQRRQKLLSRSETLRTKCVRTQQPAQSLEHGWIIVHNGNPRGRFRHERSLPPCRKPVDWPLGQQVRFRYFEASSFSAMRTRSATVRMPSFSIIRLRWTLMVFSTVPSSPAICLFSRPATTCVRTSCSRGVSLFNFACIDS